MILKGDVAADRGDRATLIAIPPAHVDKTVKVVPSHLHIGLWDTDSLVWLDYSQVDALIRSAKQPKGNIGPECRLARQSSMGGHNPYGSSYDTGSPAANPYVFSPPAMPIGSVWVNWPVSGL